MESHDLLHRELFEKNSLLNKFIYSCSHDLKGPLASIKGLVNLAETSIQNDLTAECLNHINESVSRMDRCVSALEVLMNNSWEPVIHKEVNFSEIIDKLVEECTDQLKKGDIKLNVRVKKDRQFYSDPVRIRTIIENLLQNAITYQKASKPAKVIDLLVEVFDDHVNIEVCDNGEGIQKNRLSEIFKIFYRGTERSKGSGLGLYIVKEMVVKLNGIITVASSRDVGSNFAVKIPNMEA